MKNDFKRVKYACYASNVSMSVISAFQPLLFLTFREMYDISYSLLGLLILINFCTQLCVDLIFSFFSHKFNISKSVKLTPVITFIGLIIYALAPFIFPNNIYIGLVLGTIIFSASGGLGEVLISRIIAAIPSDNPEREMSKLHSIFAWGVVGVVLFCTFFLKFVGRKYWQILSFILTLIPLTSVILYFRQEMPHLSDDDHSNAGLKVLKTPIFALCVLCIFLGGATENIMSQWSSSYIEKALNIPKALGDIFGVAIFSVMLGLGRSLYAKFGKNVTLVLVICSTFAFICYLVATLSSSPIIALVACGLTGLATSMLWPGSLIAASPRFEVAGVAMFALMAAGGDLGASLGPQLMGIITDVFIKNEHIIEYALTNNISIEQIAMKAGLLTMAIFPLLSIIANSFLHIVGKKHLIKKDF